jgi:uncharacterized protein involved in exopolysaccharide biosynthesis
MSTLSGENELPPESTKDSADQFAYLNQGESKTAPLATQTLASILWQNRRRLFRGTAIAVVIFGVCAFVIPKRWESSATLMPPDDNDSASAALQGLIAAKAGPGLGAVASEMFGTRNPTYVMMGILESDTVARDIVDRFDLRKVYRRKLYVDAEKDLKRHTDIEDVRLAGMITIRVTDSDPVRARDMAQAYVDELNSMVVQLTTSSAHREKEFLEERLKSIKTGLDASSLALSEFSSKTRTMGPEIQGRAMLAASADLQGNLIAAESELRALQQNYSPDNPRVRSASARVAELREQLNKMAGTGGPVTPATSDGSNEELYPSMSELPILGNTYEDLYRRVQLQESVYEALTKEYEIAKVQEAKEIPSVRLLDPPRVPEKKAWPPKALIILLGGMLGFIASLLMVLAERACAALDPDDPRRIMLNKLANITGYLPWRSRRRTVANGS